MRHPEIFMDPELGCIRIKGQCFPHPAIYYRLIGPSQVILLAFIAAWWRKLAGLSDRRTWA